MASYGTVPPFQDPLIPIEHCDMGYDTFHQYSDKDLETWSIIQYSTNSAELMDSYP